MRYGHICKEHGRTVFLLFFLLSLHACASTKALPGFSAGEQKNSLPFMEEKSLEETHSVAIPPFYGDDAGWRAITGEIIASSPRLSVIPSEKLDSKVRDLSAFMPEQRLAFLGSLGKSVQADAVVNGIILHREKSDELIVQLISSEGSRILWWQAVDLRLPAGSLSPLEQKALLSQLLDPLISRMGKREKTGPPVATGPEAGKEEQQRSDSLQQKESPPKGDEQQKSPTKPKADKKSKKTPRPKPSEEDINPM